MIQSGHYNERVYLMKMKPEDFPAVIDYVNKKARSYGYTKIFCKIPFWASPTFISGGFIVEAQIPCFYKARDDAYFVSKFLNSDRLLSIENDQLVKLTQALATHAVSKPMPFLRDEFSFAKIGRDRSREVAEVYGKVFETYPFPIYDPEYISNSFHNDVHYFGIEMDRQIVALSSAEIDRENANAEMTDFAILPEHRGNQLAIILLKEMEHEMLKQGIRTLYTICRLNSIPINKVFLRLHYKYGGTLIKNSNIAGNIESMNVYYKHI